jgi:hypothetical protein
MPWQPVNGGEAKNLYNSSGLNASRSAAGGLYIEIDSKFYSVQDGCRVLTFIVRARIFPDQSDEVLVPPRHHLVRFAPSKPHTILRLERDPLERCAIHQVFLAMNGSTASACSLGHSASKADSGSSATFTLSIHEAILAARNFAVL